MADEPKTATFADLYAAHARDVYRFALYLSGQPAVAQDITAETFLRVWASPAPVRLSSVKAWLFMIARNLYRHELRHIRRRLPLAPEIASVDSVSTSAERKQEFERVSTALAALPEIDRTAVLLRVEGLSYEEIASLAEISVAAAKVKVHRARLRLAKEGLGEISHEYLERRRS